MRRAIVMSSACCAGFLVITFAYCRWLGAPWHPWQGWPTFLPPWIAGSVLCISALFVQYPKGVPALWSRIWHASIITALLILTHGAFHAVKVTIGRPTFHAEALVAGWDATLHGPKLSHRLAAALGPALIGGIDRIYSSWPLLLFVFLLWVAWWQQGRALVAWTLLWMIGVAVAVPFSSAGPIFLDYTPIPESPSARSSGILWHAYTSGEYLAFAGISAFPSLHVAGTTVIALATRGIAQIGAYALLAVIFIGSVALGWHYAIDGYAGILIAVTCWRLAGRMTR